MSIVDRFWAKVSAESADSCWLWTGSKNLGGYGIFNVRSRGTGAHRWAYEALRDEIPEGLHLDHLCRTPACVNPWHLEPVTPLENTRRGIGHGSETHCPKGHAYDEANTYRTPRGCRNCRPCNAEAVRQYRARKQAAA